jgi:hypothetical protein
MVVIVLLQDKPLLLVAVMELMVPVKMVVQAQVAVVLVRLLDLARQVKVIMVAQDTLQIYIPAVAVAVQAKLVLRETIAQTEVKVPLLIVLGGLILLLENLFPVLVIMLVVVAAQVIKVMVLVLVVMAAAVMESLV